MAYSTKQKRVAYHFYDVARRKKASRKELLALLEAGLVEANLGNPRGGDRDSVGSLQERGHYGSVGRRLNVRKAAARFLGEAKRERGNYRTAGQLAQAVQRSAYPDRYDQRRKQAKDLLRHLDKTHGTKAKFSSKKTVTESTPGVDNSAARQQLKMAYLEQRGRPDALLNLAAGLQGAKDVPGKTTTRVVRRRGKPAKGGRRTSTDIERIAAKARSMGLRVGGNQGVQGHPESSGHTAGSYHYKKARKKGWQSALDISGDPRQMAKLANYLSKRYGRDLEELIYRGPGSKNRHNIKRGRRVGKGFYSAHGDHVHVADVD